MPAIMPKEMIEGDVLSNKMYQVSTLQALAMGYSRGVIPVGELLEHGSIGLGTFEDVDGEMIVLDGRVYRAGKDGEAAETAPDVKTPFAAVGDVSSGRTFGLEGVTDIASLKERLTLAAEEIFGLNSMHIARIDGDFESLSARSESAYRSHHVELKDMLALTQKDFVFGRSSGTLVCVYYPDFMDGINAAGWHMHFLSEDHAHGGHVFEMSLIRGEVSMYKIDRLEIRLPGTPAFDTYSLKQASQADIKHIEQGEKA